MIELDDAVIERFDPIGGKELGVRAESPSLAGRVKNFWKVPQVMLAITAARVDDDRRDVIDKRHTIVGDHVTQDLVDVLHADPAEQNLMHFAARLGVQPELRGVIAVEPLFERGRSVWIRHGGIASRIDLYWNGPSAKARREHTR